MRWLLLGIILNAAAIAQAATIPFDDSSGRPMIALTVNGKGPYPFILDTGSPDLLVSQALVDELGLTVIGKSPMQSPLNQGTPLETNRVAVASVGLGDVSVANLEADVLNISGAGLGMGVIGPAVFQKYGTIKLDFVHNTITLGKDARAPAIKTWLPFGASAPLLDVPIRIGELIIPGHLDTGSLSGLTLPDSYTDRITLGGPVRTVGVGRTVDAEFAIRAARFGQAVQIGDAIIQLPEIQFADVPVANLGTAALHGLNLYIDWENKRFALQGNANIQMHVASPGTRPRFGLRARPSNDGTIQVVGTDTGSAAEAIGLLAGDQITAVNGHPVTEIPPAQLRDQFAQLNLTLTVRRDGKEVQLSSKNQ